MTLLQKPSAARKSILKKTPTGPLAPVSTSEAEPAFQEQAKGKEVTYLDPNKENDKKIAKKAHHDKVNESTSNAKDRVKTNDLKQNQNDHKSINDPKPNLNTSTSPNECSSKIPSPSGPFLPQPNAGPPPPPPPPSVKVRRL